MATTAPMRPLRLAAVGLGLAYLLLASHGTAAATTELRHASVLPRDTTLFLAGRPVSTHHRRASTTSTSTTEPDDAAPRRLDVSAVAREDSTSPATAAPAPPARSSCPCVCVLVGMREAAVEDLVPAPVGVTGAAVKKALLHTLPLLAVPFLPTPLAALVALSALAAPVRAGHLSNGTCHVLEREGATCTVYRYLPGGCADRTQPFAGLRQVCPADSDERALSGACAWGQRHGDPLHSYCRVRTLELYDDPARLNFRVLPGHLPPIYNPDAVVASGGDVCYVEVEQRDYREGYYILCPFLKFPRLPFLCCPELPHHATV